jgi:hypothetical protein
VNQADVSSQPETEASPGLTPPATPRGVATRLAPWPRRYAITSPDGVVGYTNLEFPVDRGERAAGTVIPADAYDAARAVFALYHEAAGDRERLRRFVEARDALHLSVTDGAPVPLQARIELISEAEPGRIVAHVATSDGRYWALHGALGRAAGTPTDGASHSVWAALRAPTGSGHGWNRGVWSSAWVRASERGEPAEMKRKKALELQQEWGDKPCPHPAFAKEYDLGERTGNFVCTQCGAIVSQREKLEIQAARGKPE